MENLNFYDCNSKKGIIVISHGMGEHQGLYKDTAMYFNEQGYGVITYDVLGHGQNRQKKIKYQDLVNTLYKVVEKARKMDSRIYLLGFSMGALISSLYATKHDNISGLIVISGKYKVMKTIIIPGILLGNKTLKLNFLDVNKRHTPDESFLTDENLLKSVKFKLLYEILYKGLKQLNIHVKSIRTKTLILHGGSDLIVDHLESVQFYESLQSPKEIIIYPYSKHDLLFDIDSDLIRKDIVTFLNEITH